MLNAVKFLFYLLHTAFGGVVPSLLDKVIVIFDAISPHLSFLYDQTVFISRTFYLLIEMNEVTNLQEQYQQAICQSCSITSMIVVSDYL